MFYAHEIQPHGEALQMEQIKQTDEQVTEVRTMQWTAPQITIVSAEAAENATGAVADGGIGNS